jgi:LacI family transcriptional regulator
MRRAGQKSEANISEVANHAGVSTATVSRVISGVGYVSELTRKRVKNSIDVLDYQPSSIAQSLRRKSSNMIGLIVTDIQNPFYPELVRGIEDEVHRLGYSLILCNSDNDQEREKAYLEFLSSNRAAGIIVCADGFVNRHRSKLLIQRSKVILVNMQKLDNDLPTVLSQDYEGGKKAASHLVNCGYPSLIYIANELEKVSGSLRMDGVKAGAGKRPLKILYSTDTLEAGTKIFNEISKISKPPFGIVAHNDLVAIGIMHKFLENKFRVPQDIGIVGYDDIAISKYIFPSLTTINQNQYLLGVEAMSILHSDIKGDKNYEEKVILSELVIRNSTMKTDNKSK